MFGTQKTIGNTDKLGLMKKLFFSIYWIGLSLFMASCGEQPKAIFHPFEANNKLTYEHLVDAGFYRLTHSNDEASNSNSLTRFAGNKQLQFDFTENDCQPNILNNGTTCYSHKVTNRIFNQYYSTFDSLKITQTIQNYGGEIRGNWKNDWIAFNHDHEKVRSWHFPISFKKHQYIGEVWEQDQGKVVLRIRESSMHAESKQSSIEAKKEANLESTLRLTARKVLDIIP